MKFHDSLQSVSIPEHPREHHNIRTEQGSSSGVQGVQITCVIVLGPSLETGQHWQDGFESSIINIPKYDRYYLYIALHSYIGLIRII
jgi:hypothetical protein